MMQQGKCSGQANSWFIANRTLVCVEATASMRTYEDPKTGLQRTSLSLLHRMYFYFNHGIIIVIYFMNPRSFWGEGGCPSKKVGLSMLIGFLPRRHRDP